jgi:hypothetical protein
MVHRWLGGTALVSLLFCSCGGDTPKRPPPVAGQGGATDTGGSGGGVGIPGLPGVGGSAAGGSGGSVAGSGGSGGSSGSGGASGSGGSGGTPQPPAVDGGTPVDGGAKLDAPAPSAPGQGPTAMGKIVYSEDFENGLGAITRSPDGLPMERAVVVDDPLGQRGKVVRVIWQMGDNFRTSSGTQPRSWISSATAYQVKPGTKVSFAWGMQWTTATMDAFFSQNIGPGPVWELRVRANGRFQILCNQCGGNSPDLMPITPNRWYDFRVDMDWQAGGKILFYVDGQMVYQSTMGGASANCHWDGGIYNTPGGTAMNTTRTVYISNLSIGER